MEARATRAAERAAQREQRGGDESGSAADLDSKPSNSLIFPGNTRIDHHFYLPAIKSISAPARDESAGRMGNEGNGAATRVAARRLRKTRAVSAVARRREQRGARAGLARLGTYVESGVSSESACDDKSGGAGSAAARAARRQGGVSAARRGRGSARARLGAGAVRRGQRSSARAAQRGAGCASDKSSGAGRATRAVKRRQERQRGAHPRRERGQRGISE